MRTLKTIFAFIITSTLLLSFAACSQQKENPNVVKVGTIAGPETQLMQVAKQVAAKKYGLDIEIVQFTDYNMPNEALANGSIDANMFQHLPYLTASIKANGYKLSPIAETFVYPMAIYSKKIKNISQVKDGDVVAIPNDPSNEARALLLLQKAKLITLKPGTNITATIADIATNPKHLSIKEIDAAQLPRVLPDVTIAAINTNYAAEAGLLPTKNGLVIEGADSPYANLIVVRTADVNDPRFVKLVNAFHSPEVLAEAKILFKGQAIPAWNINPPSNAQNSHAGHH